MRNMLSAFCLVGLLVAGAASASAADEVKLVPKYEAGKTQVFQNEMTLTQQLNLAGMTIDTAVNVFETQSLEVLESTGDGGAKCRLKPTKFQIELSLPGGITVSFDSDNPNQEPDNAALKPVFDVFRVAATSQTSFEIASDGEIKNIKYEAEGLDELDDMFKDSFTPERLKIELGQAFGRLPKTAVAPGDTWTKSETFDAGNGQTISFEVAFTYDGTVEQNGKTLDKISVNYKSVDFSIDAGSSLPLQVESTDLKADGSTGTMLFDREAGRLVAQDSKVKIKGKIGFTANGQALPAELDLTIESKRRLQP